MFNANADFYRTCFEAFGEEDFQVILALGTRVSLESLGTPPANFLIVPRVPQIALLERVRAFVSHGGMNSVNESLSFGVPLVVIPQMSEQELVGRQVEALGAGVCLTRGAVKAEAWRGAPGAGGDSVPGVSGGAGGGFCRGGGRGAGGGRDRKVLERRRSVV